MLSTRECFDVLELPPGANPLEVRRAWRDLVRVWHPDRFAHDPGLQRRAEDRLKRINEAYERLRTGRMSTVASAEAPRPPTAAKAEPRFQFRPQLLGWGARLCLGLALAGAAGGLFQQLETGSLMPGSAATVDLDSSPSKVPVIETPAKIPPPRRPVPRALPVRPPPSPVRSVPAGSREKRATPQTASVFEWSISPDAPAATSVLPRTEPPATSEVLVPPHPKLLGLAAADRDVVASICELSRRRGPRAFERCLDFQLSLREVRRRLDGSLLAQSPQRSQ